MSTQHDPELAAWSEGWREGGTPVDVEALRRKVRIRGRRLLAFSVSEVILSALAIAALAIVGVRGDAVDAALAWSMSALTVAVLAASLWTRRGTYRPAAESTRDYVALALLRAGRALLGVRIAWATLAVEVLALVPWLWHRATAGDGPVRTGVLLRGGIGLALSVAVAVAVLVQLAARIRRDRDEARRLGEHLRE